MIKYFNPFSTNPTKWSNRLKQYVRNCLSVLDDFVGLALKGLRNLDQGYRCFKQYSNEAFSALRLTLKNNLSTEEFVHNNKVHGCTVLCKP